MRGGTKDNIILMDNIVYKSVQLNNEVQEFEPLVIEHIKDIFGEGAKYYSKRTVKTLANNRSIPDGFVINLDNKKWYILELKLLCDDAINRISRQIVNYKNAVNNLSTKKDIYEAINDSSQDLYNIIYNTKPEIVIIIDSLDGEKGQQFEEQVHGTDRNINIVEFKTYAQDYVKPDKIHLHFFNPISKTKYKNVIQKPQQGDWMYELIKDYLDGCKEPFPPTYAYFEILVREDRTINRKELIKLISKKLNQPKFNGYSLAGIQTGISRYTKSKNRDRLDFKSDDSKEFGINAKYKLELKKYFKNQQIDTSEEIKDTFNGLKEWNFEEIKKYLERLNKYHPASYAYFEILIKEDIIITRKELIQMIGKKINDDNFNGYSLAGVQMGITSNSTKVGYTRLDFKSKDSGNFGINKKYRKFLRQYFNL